MNIPLPNFWSLMQGRSVVGSLQDISRVVTGPGMPFDAYVSRQWNSGNHYDFVILSKTWLRPSTPNRLLAFPGYPVKRAYRSYKPLGHGGVAIVFRDLCVCKPIIKVTSSDDSTCRLESVWSLFTWDTMRRLIVAA